MYVPRTGDVPPVPVLTGATRLNPLPLAGVFFASSARWNQAVRRETRPDRGPNRVCSKWIAVNIEGTSRAQRAKSGRLFVLMARIPECLAAPWPANYASNAMRVLFLLLAIFCARSAATAEVYRWVDDQGRVVYSDQPHPGAEKIDSRAVQTIPSVAPSSTAVQPQPPQPQGIASGYLTFAIIAPADQENIHNPDDGNVTVSVMLQPSLDVARGHRLVLKVDGNRSDETTKTTEFVLHNVDRGTHQVQALVVDGNNDVVKSTPPVTFHVHRTIARPKAP